jgi:VanZ family protein
LSKSTWIKCGCVAAAFFMAAILFVGARKIGVVNSVPPLTHKVEHFFYYGAMAALIAFGVGRQRIWIALLVVPLIGAMDEWYQLTVPRRNGSPMDWAVDVLGVVVALYVVWRWMGRAEGKGESKNGAEVRGPRAE